MTSVLTPEIERSLAAQEARLLRLEANWDGYGAPPLPEQRIKRLVSILRTVLAEIKLFCEIVPGADGSIQAEWYLFDGYVILGIGGNDELYLDACPHIRKKKNASS